MKFSIETYHKLKEREISKLMDTAKDFFHLLAEFAKVNNLSKEMAVLILSTKSKKFIWIPAACFSSVSIRTFLIPMNIARS